MAATIPRGFDDVLTDHTVDMLKAFSAEQASFDPAVAFTSERDRRRPPSTRELPLVNVWVDGNTPESRGATARTVGAEEITVNVDCIAYASTDGGDDDSDKAAALRLAYLKEQVRQALYMLISADLGFAPGVISRRSWPTWTLYKDESGNPEESVIGGRWTFTVAYAWTPEDVQGLPVSEISVDVGLWSGFYHLNRAIASGGATFSGAAEVET
jgi:hypothetical protein